MKAKEVFELLKGNGAYRLESCGWQGDIESAFEQVTKVIGFHFVTVLDGVRAWESGVWSGYMAGFIVQASSGKVVGFFATDYFFDQEDDSWHRYTYIAGIEPVRAKIVVKVGFGKKMGEPPREYSYWDTEKTEEEIELPVLPKELAKRLLEEMRKATYVRFLSNGKPIVFPEVSME